MPGFRKKHKSKVKWLSMKDACYIAGLFDGEGWITLRVRENDKKKIGEWIHVSCSVGIANTYLPIIDYLQETVGTGKIYESKIDKKHPKHCQNWTINSLQEATDFLSQIYPYLKIKKDIVRESVGYLFFKYKNRLKRYKWAKESIPDCETFTNSRKRNVELR